jgi:O-antigen/teichoic acid export membrane protein
MTQRPEAPEAAAEFARGGTRLARHSLVSFAGYAVPLALAVVAIPIAARELGPVRFGLLGLAWAVIEYLSFVDLALGRTSVRFIAEGLARGGREIRQTAAVAVAVQAVGGLMAATILALFSAQAAYSLFSIPAEVRPEAAAMFRAVAANVAVVVLIAAIRGVLEGARRFDVSNALKIPSATAAILVPAVGAVAGLSLAGILWVVFLLRLGVLAVAFGILPRSVPGFAWELPRQWSLLRRMFSYSAWLAVSGVINPVLVTFDRMALGAILGSAAVGYYTAPYEAATRLLAVATSAFAALFPAITSELARGERWRTNRVLESTLRQMLLVFALPTILLFAFAPELLRAWLGTEFAERGTTAFRLLLIGVLANALAHVPFVYLYAAGRPDIPAKNHLLELVIHIPLTIVLIRGIGPAGAATAWTVRVLLDAGLLFWAASRSGGLDRQSAQLRYWRSALGCVLFLLGVGAVITLSGGLQLAAGVGLAAIGALLYALAAWLLALRPEERAAWLGLLAGLKRSRSG